MASMGPRCMRVALMARTFVRCRPMGLGRAGERVEKTPVRGLAVGRLWDKPVRHLWRLDAATLGR